MWAIASYLSIINHCALLMPPRFAPRSFKVFVTASQVEGFF